MSKIKSMFLGIKERIKMKKNITYQDIIELKPCYDPIEIGMSNTYQSSLVEAIEEYKNKVENKIDILWVAKNYLDDKTLRLFAVWCARKALQLLNNPDPRSINACDIAEKFANGQAIQEELTAARDTAWAVAWSATRACTKDAAGAAAWACTIATARAAAWGAARDTVRAAAWTARAAARNAARAAARNAARDAALDAAWTTEDAAWKVAEDAAWDAQIEQLLKMTKEYTNE